MTRVAAPLLGVALALALPMAASALSLYGEGTTNANASAGGVHVDASVSASTSANTNTNGQSATTGNAGGETRGIDNALIHVTANDAVQAEAVLTNLADVHTSADVSAYAKGIMRADAKVQDVTVASDSVSVSYREPARFLWVFPASLTATATVGADGTVAVSYPWYSFLMSAPRATDIETSIQAGVAANTGASANAGLSVSEQAQLLQSVASAFASANASAGTR